ncbi:MULTISPECIES: glutathione S-transferase family protein [Sphingomonas]|uniref:glutathione S-transferase family protein n=1 Tax=Sphingomonas TaxID=13687 RepID=UPI0008368023|nr:glutathione S-transferase family protein [Sphingomonas pituitosa]
MITLYAFGSCPDFARGLTRDLRVRWALEEAGLPYETVLIDYAASRSSAHLELNPFGQVPAVQAAGLPTFESGAIVLHIAEKSETLLPSDPGARAAAISWMFAALNSIEPMLLGLLDADIFHAREPWAKEMRAAMEARATKRLALLEAHLENREYVTGQFTAADLLMTTVLRMLRHTELLGRFPHVSALKERCQARPAFQKALADQLSSLDRTIGEQAR